MQDYQKRLKKYYKEKEKQNRSKRNNPEAKEKAKQTYFDKLYFRIFLSALILLSIISIDRFVLDNQQLLQNELSEHMNVLKFASFFNGIFGDGIFIPSPDDIPAVSESLYPHVEFEHGVNIITDETFAGVMNAVPGVVVKIQKNSEGKYTITLKGIDDRLYHYGNLESIDFNIYSYVSENTILGKASFEGGEYTFTLQIEEGGKYLNFYEICED